MNTHIRRPSQHHCCWKYHSFYRGSSLQVRIVFYVDMDRITSTEVLFHEKKLEEGSTVPKWEKNVRMWDIVRHPIPTVQMSCSTFYFQMAILIKVGSKRSGLPNERDWFENLSSLAMSAKKRARHGKRTSEHDIKECKLMSPDALTFHLWKQKRCILQQ